MYDKPLFFPAGDRAIVVELGDSISPDINRRVRSLTDALEEVGVPGVFDFLPTYRSVLVYYDPLVAPASDIRSGIERLLERAEESDTDGRHVVHIRRCTAAKWDQTSNSSRGTTASTSGKSSKSTRARIILSI